MFNPACSGGIGMKQTVKRLIKDLFEFKWHIIFILVCAILIVLSNLFIPLYIGRAIDSIKSL